tara:strand:- start:1026 stop:1310 length:285 start_codon:yes stop_codon:yes gene_type:complete
MPLTYKQQFNKKHDQPLNKSNSLQEISKLSGYKLKGLKTIREKGEGAFYSSPQSVRAHITNPTAWGIARVYAAVNPKSKAHQKDKSHLEKKKKK